MLSVRHDIPMSGSSPLVPRLWLHFTVKSTTTVSLPSTCLLLLRHLPPPSHCRRSATQRRSMPLLRPWLATWRPLATGWRPTDDRLATDWRPVTGDPCGRGQAIYKLIEFHPAGNFRECVANLREPAETRCKPNREFSRMRRASAKIDSITFANASRFLHVTREGRVCCRRRRRVLQCEAPVWV
jgi:hypothetical protein